MLKLAEIRNSGFARLVAACLAFFFVAWTLLPHCHCLFSGNVSGATAQQKTWPAETAVASSAAGEMGAECHCSDHAPTCLDSPSYFVEVPSCYESGFAPMYSEHEFFSSAIPVVNKSSGPPKGDEVVAENCLAAYIRHCAFLI